MKNTSLFVITLILLLTPIALFGQAQPGDLSFGLYGKYHFIDGGNSISVVMPQIDLYLSKDLALGGNFDINVVTFKDEREVEARVALQLLVRYYFLSPGRLQFLVQGSLGLGKLLTFDGSGFINAGVAAGSHLFLSNRLGINGLLLFESTADGFDFGLSFGIDYSLNIIPPRS
ncbi:MAG: hypothetical protein IPJ40_04130 [Saprospirales bacterium]|nr:hypothetical protein [Saprospirales bacterium]